MLPLDRTALATKTGTVSVEKIGSSVQLLSSGPCRAGVAPSVPMAGSADHAGVALPMDIRGSVPLQQMVALSRATYTPPALSRLLVHP